MSVKYKNLFQPGMIGNIKVKNRIILSPMGDEMATSDGVLTEASIAYYVERAKGGVGVVVTGATCVDFPQGRGLISQAALDRQEHVEGFKKLAALVHKEGALLIPQLYHSGLLTSMDKTSGMPIKAATHVKLFAKGLVDEYDSAIIEEFTTQEVQDVVQKYIRSAMFAKEAGCDGVAIHGAHMALLHQFFCKALNKRKDQYGGSFENRTRIAIEIVEGIRKACGEDFCILFRLPAKDYFPFGLGVTEKDAVELTQKLIAVGVDLIDVTGGTDHTNKRSLCVEPQGFAEGFRAHLAKPIKAVATVPVATVGMLRTPQMCDDLIGDGVVDFVTLGRSLICDPQWPQKAERGEEETILKCISCNEGCFSPILLNEHRPVTCTLNPKVSREHLYGTIEKADVPKKVVVIGAGPGGIQAALTASERGHEVTLIEQNEKIGGQLHLAAAPPGKSSIKEAIEWYKQALQTREVTVRLGELATLELIQSLEPDCIIMATGATPINPPIKGGECAINSWTVLANKPELLPSGKSVTVIGGGIVGAETAHLLAEQGNKVTILEMNNEIAPGMEPYTKLTLMRHLKELKVKKITQAKVVEIAKDRVTYERRSKTKKVKSDVVVMAIGQRPHGQDLLEQLKAAGFDVRAIGDMTKVGKIITATEQGFLVALEL